MIEAGFHLDVNKQYLNYNLLQRTELIQIICGYTVVGGEHQSQSRKTVFCFNLLTNVAVHEYRSATFRCLVVVGTIFVYKMSQFVIISIRSYR